MRSILLLRFLDSFGYFEVYSEGVFYWCISVLVYSKVN